jgi:hypothetical protein
MEKMNVSSPPRNVLPSSHRANIKLSTPPRKHGHWTARTLPDFLHPSSGMIFACAVAHNLRGVATLHTYLISRYEIAMVFVVVTWRIRFRVRKSPGQHLNSVRYVVALKAKLVAELPPVPYCTHQYAGWFSRSWPTTPRHPTYCYCHKASSSFFIITIFARRLPPSAVSPDRHLLTANFACWSSFGSLFEDKVVKARWMK